MIHMPHWPKPLGNRPMDFSLNRIKSFLDKLGNPEKKMPPIVHIAGTNGKGSTLSFIRYIMQAAGYKVHAYTSPHLVNFNERIIIAGSYISDNELYSLLEECRAVVEDQPITLFEAATIAAFLAFSHHKADITLIETGIGGRLDATNIINNPILTIITSIALDHTEYLGSTIEAIASEKAGIMKPNVPCVITPQEKSVMKVLESYAVKTKSSLYRGDIEWTCVKQRSVIPVLDTGIQKQKNEWTPASRYEHCVSTRPFTYVSSQYLAYSCTNIVFLKPVAKKVASSQCLTLGSSIHYSPFGLCFHGKYKNYLQAKPTGSQCRSTGMTSSVVENRSKIQCSYTCTSRAGARMIFQSSIQSKEFPLPSLSGDHQVTNAGTAIAACSILSGKYGFDIGKEDISSGLQNTNWPARLEHIKGGHLISSLPKGFQLFLDGAHNSDGARVLAKWLKDNHAEGVYVIFGVTRNRNVQEFLQHLKPYVKLLYAICVQSEPNAASTSLIREAADEMEIKSIECESITDAILNHIAKIPIQNIKTILICGSLFLARDLAIENS